MGRRNLGMLFFIILSWGLSLGDCPQHLLTQGAFAKPVLELEKDLTVKPVTVKKSSVRQKLITVHQEADELEYDDKAKVMKLHGHVRLTQAESILNADDATYYLNTEEAEARGNLKLTRPDGVLTGDHLHLYYREKHADFDGHVTLLRTFKKNEEIKENEVVDKSPITISADELQYQWEAKLTKAKGHVSLIQGKRKAYADSGVYDEPLDRLEMEGNVRLERPPKDELECDHLIYFLKTNQAKANGHVRGKFMFQEKNASAPESTKKP